MTILSASKSGFGLPLAILVNGHETALFTGLITYLAVLSIGVWALVLLSTVARIFTRRVYRWRMQRRLPIEIE